MMIESKAGGRRAFGVLSALAALVPTSAPPVAAEPAPGYYAR